jgi:hypothetical protein
MDVVAAYNSFFQVAAAFLIFIVGFSALSVEPYGGAHQRLSEKSIDSRSCGLTSRFLFAFLALALIFRG